MRTKIEHRGIYLESVIRTVEGLWIEGWHKGLDMVGEVESVGEDGEGHKARETREYLSNGERR